MQAVRPFGLQVQAGVLLSEVGIERQSKRAVTETPVKLTSELDLLDRPASAEAIKYAVESLKTPALLSAAYVVGEDRYEGPEIRALYEGKRFPLSRGK